MIAHRFFQGHWMLCFAVLIIGGCASKKPYSIDLMPAPEVYSQGAIDPFSDLGSPEEMPYRGMLYATDRAPSTDQGEFYQNKRGNVVRLGIGRLEIGEENFSWEEARKISLLKNRPGNYPLKITSVEEFGILDRSISAFTDPSLLGEATEKPREQFIDLINKKLSLSKRRDIFIYVHGYKVGFENPLLVASELWHFLGYDGVFIAYAWPSTPKTLAYGADLETAAMSAQFLQLLIEVLAEQSHADHIHIIGYSAGTRVVILSLYQLALLHHDMEADDIRNKLRIGHVILIGSDFGRSLFGAYVHNGLLNTPNDITVYMSKTDKALNMSRRIFSQGRLGEMWTEGALGQAAVDFLEKHFNLRMINVTSAQGAATGNGHAYFRKSPWVSSDVLITLMYDLAPGQRGLVRMPGMPVWSFPEDYLERVKNVLKSANPEVFK